MGKRKIEKLSSTIEKLLSARGWGAKLKEYRIFAVWEKAVGPALARHARPAGIRGRKLTIIVDSNAWMQQLSLLRPEIIGKVNQSLAQDAVDSITLKLGEVEQSGRQPDTYRPPAGTLDPGERGKIEEYVGAIADPGVRESLRQVMEKDFLNKKRTRRPAT
jgi:hypothetical protein